MRSSDTARDQVIRLLALVPYLQNRGGVSLRKIAEDFEISTQQVRSDLNVLWFCGLPGLGAGDLIDLNFTPLEADEDGIVKVSNAEYLSKPLRLGVGEASALLVALRVLRDSTCQDTSTVIDRVLDKLQRATSDRGHIALGVDSAGEPSAVLDTRRRLTEAIATDHQVRLEYYVPARDERTERVVDPIALIEHDGFGYLDAWCHRAQGRRRFRLDRVDSVEVLDARRAHADEAPLNPSDGLFSPGPESVRVTLLLAPGARWIIDYYPIVSAAEVADGSVRVELDVTEPGWLQQLVLRSAPDVRIVEPREWADAVRNRAQATLNWYQG